MDYPQFATFKEACDHKIDDKQHTCGDCKFFISEERFISSQSNGDISELLSGAPLDADDLLNLRRVHKAESVGAEPGLQVQDVNLGPCPLQLIFRDPPLLEKILAKAVFHGPTS